MYYVCFFLHKTSHSKTNSRPTNYRCNIDATIELNVDINKTLVRKHGCLIHKWLAECFQTMDFAQYFIIFSY